MIGILLAAALVFLLIRNAAVPEGDMVEITVDNQVFGTYSLEEDRTVKIGEGNICEIRNGQARMIWADCPDQLCVHQAAIGHDGGNIICLPNCVVLSVTGEGGGSTDTTDTVAS